MTQFYNQQASSKMGEKIFALLFYVVYLAAAVFNKSAGIWLKTNNNHAVDWNVS